LAEFLSIVSGLNNPKPYFDRHRDEYPPLPANEREWIVFGKNGMEEADSEVFFLLFLSLFRFFWGLFWRFYIGC
jgi:hypothetical protein